MSMVARIRPKPRLRKVSCIREYSPLSSIIAPLITFRLGGVVRGIVRDP